MSTDHELHPSTQATPHEMNTSPPRTIQAAIKSGPSRQARTRPPSPSFLRAVELEAGKLRGLLEGAFSPDTAKNGWGWLSTAPSAGHCAAAAAIFEVRGSEVDGAQVECVSVTTDVLGSHWFNRVTRGDEVVDVDLTGDQFGRPAVQVAPADSLYDAGARVRPLEDVDEETRARAERLAKKAGLDVRFPTNPG